MSGLAVLELALAALGLAACALSALVALRLAGRVSLESGVYAGLAAFTSAQAPWGLGLAAALAVGVASLAGAAIGRGAAPLDAPRGAALGLVALFGFEAAAPRLAFLGGHMGLPVGPLTPADLVVALVGAAALSLGPWHGARSAAGRRWVDLAVLAVEAPDLFASLGRRLGRLRMAIGAGAGALAGGGGLLMASGLEHLHHRAFGLSLGLDALAVGLLAGPSRPLETAGLRVLLVAAAWTGIVHGLAGHPALRPVLLASVLGLGALYWGRPGAPDAP